MKSPFILLTLLLQLALTSLTHADAAVVEAQFVRMEYYESSNEYTLYYRRCKACASESKRLDNDSRINLNNQPSGLRSVYALRHTLQRNVDFAYSKSTNKIVWLSVMQETSR